MAILLGLLIMVYGLTFSYTGTLVLSPMMLPFLTGVALFLFGLAEQKQKEKITFPDLKKFRPPLVVLVLLMGYVCLLKAIGFMGSTILFAGVLVIYFGGGKKEALITGVSLGCGLYIFFHLLLQVPLP